MNKKSIIINVIIAIIFFFIGGTVGSSVTKNSYNKKINQSNSNVEQQSKNEQNTKKEDKTEEKIKLNQIEKFKGVELKVLNAKEVDNVSNESGKTKASGKFIIIEISMKNTSKEAIEYSPNDFKLLNNGTEYQGDDNSFETLQNLTSQKTIFDKNKDYVGPYDKFNPGITKKTFIAFDIPKDLSLKNTKLIVGGNEDIQFDLTK